MCGIFGIIHTAVVEAQAFYQLAQLNLTRGNLAFGYLTGRFGETDVETNVFRYPQPFLPNLVQFDEVQMALGHIRAPTGGQSPNERDIHPLEVTDAWLAHNGLLLNHWQHPEWQLNADSQIDSQFILGGIQTQLRAGLPPAQAIRNTIEKLDGQQACWLWHKSTGTLYLWRVMSPIYVQQTPEQFVFSSVKPSPVSELLSEGVVYRFRPELMTLEPVDYFGFYSPYQINEK